MNKVIFMGRLVADPEFSQTQGGKSVCKFRIAVDRAFQKDSQEKQSDFFQLVAFGKTAEFVSKYFTNGKPAIIEGRIQNNNFQGKDGKMQYHNQLIADSVMFTLSDPTRGTQQAPTAQNYQAPVQNTIEDFSDFEQISDGNLPF